MSVAILAYLLLAFICQVLIYAILGQRNTL